MARKRTYSDEQLKKAIKASFSWANVLRILGLKITGGNYSNIQTISRNLKLNWSHFTGQLWSKGKTRETDQRLEKQGKQRERPDREIFIKNCPPISGTKLRRRLRRLGWEYKCKNCGLKPF